MKNVFFCVLLVLACCASSLGQTYKLLWSFGGSPNDGGQPYEGLIADKAGNLYGTTVVGGNTATACPTSGYVGCGTVFELSPSNGAWKETLLYQFCVNGSQNNCPDGAWPSGQLLQDFFGNLYGATFSGGAYNYGTVFELSPPANPGGTWTEQVLWSFCAEGSPCPNGAGPNSPLVMDGQGNLFGTAGGGIVLNYGTVFEVSPSPSGVTESLLYSFGTNFPDDGYGPLSGVIFDSNGNLYGTTEYGFNDDALGTVYELSPNSSAFWTETVIHSFGSTRGFPNPEVAFDEKGSLYGTAQCASRTCNLGSGAIFRLTPKAQDKWVAAFLAMPSSVGNGEAANPLVINESLYGATSRGGANGYGTVFQLRGTTQTALYSFCSQPNCVDGSEPYLGGSLLMLGGRLYGTTMAGGASGQGVVFQIAP